MLSPLRAEPLTKTNEGRSSSQAPHLTGSPGSSIRQLVSVGCLPRHSGLEGRREEHGTNAQTLEGAVRWKSGPGVKGKRAMI